MCRGWGREWISWAIKDNWLKENKSQPKIFYLKKGLIIPQTKLKAHIWKYKSSFVTISLRHLHSQTVSARELKFLEKVDLPPPVTCHMSHVTCHMSCVICHMSLVTCLVSCVTFFLSFSFYRVVNLVGGKPSKCLLHHEQRRCKLFLGGVNLLL